MGRKKYYCDFCNRYFNDDQNTRIKHLNSLGHLNMKKEHYNMFRDPEVILQEESAKKPCRKFHIDGFCPFGGSCTFSHYSKLDLEAIQEDIAKKKKKQIAEIPSVDSWLEKYYRGIEEKKENSRKLLWSCELPYEMLINTSFLPPSLLPFNIKNFLDSDLETWG